MRDEKFDYIKFYQEQRDKHLEQLMEINGKLAFGVLAIIGSALIGVFGIDNKKFHFDFNESAIWLILMLVGAILLIIAIVMYSAFHTRQISYFSNKMRTTKNNERLSVTDVQITPHKSANYFVFFGLLLLLFGVLGVVFVILSQPPVPEQSLAGVKCCLSGN